MPVESSGIATEPTYSHTYPCTCPSTGFVRSHHEKGCFYNPIPPQKPSPYAGKRAWKKYRETLTKERR